MKRTSDQMNNANNSNGSNNNNNNISTTTNKKFVFKKYETQTTEIESFILKYNPKLDPLCIKDMSYRLYCILNGDQSLTGKSDLIHNKTIFHSIKYQHNTSCINECNVFIATLKCLLRMSKGEENENRFVQFPCNGESMRGRDEMHDCFPPSMKNPNLTESQKREIFISYNKKPKYFLDYLEDAIKSDHNDCSTKRIVLLHFNNVNNYDRETNETLARLLSESYIQSLSKSQYIGKSITLPSRLHFIICMESNYGVHRFKERRYDPKKQTRYRSANMNNKYHVKSIVESNFMASNRMTYNVFQDLFAICILFILDKNLSFRSKDRCADADGIRDKLVDMESENRREELRLSENILVYYLTKMEKKVSKEKQKVFLDPQRQEKVSIQTRKMGYLIGSHGEMNMILEEQKERIKERIGGGDSTGITLTKDFYNSSVLRLHRVESDVVEVEKELEYDNDEDDYVTPVNKQLKIQIESERDNGIPIKDTSNTDSNTSVVSETQQEADNVVKEDTAITNDRDVTEEKKCSSDNGLDDKNITISEINAKIDQAGNQINVHGASNTSNEHQCVVSLTNDDSDKYKEPTKGVIQNKPDEKKKRRPRKKYEGFTWHEMKYNNAYYTCDKCETVVCCKYVIKHMCKLVDINKAS